MTTVRNDFHHYSSEWDKMLNTLIEEGDAFVYDSRILTFKIYKGKSKGVFGLFRKDVYDTYEVWLSNKDAHYGALYNVNGKEVLDQQMRRTSQETMDKLFALENSLVDQNIYKL